jgi:hypothetical protein
MHHHRSRYRYLTFRKAKIRRQQISSSWILLKLDRSLITCLQMKVLSLLSLGWPVPLILWVIHLLVITPTMLTKVKIATRVKIWRCSMERHTWNLQNKGQNWAFKNEKVMQFPPKVHSMINVFLHMPSKVTGEVARETWISCKSWSLIALNGKWLKICPYNRTQELDKTKSSNSNSLWTLIFTIHSLCRDQLENTRAEEQERWALQVQSHPEQVAFYDKRPFVPAKVIKRRISWISGSKSKTLASFMSVIRLRLIKNRAQNRIFIRL